MRVESVDDGEQMPGGGVGIAGGEDPGIHPSADLGGEHALPVIHLAPHPRGERLGMRAEAPRLHPDERDVGAGPVEEGLQQHADARGRIVDGGDEGGEFGELGADEGAEGVGDERLHAVGVVRHESGGDADATRDRTERHGVEPLLERDLPRGGGELRTPLLGCLPHATGS